MTRVLIIEDHNDIRENVVEILSLSGYAVEEASNGKQGVDKALAHPPDLVLCDIMMPGLDGYGVFEALHNESSTRAIPFIFITAKSERVDVRRGMDMGADDYLTKPFDAAELLAAIESRLRKKDIHESHYSQSLEQLNALLAGIDGMGRLRELLEARKIRSFRKKEVIYREGDAATGIWLLLEGKAKATRLAEDGRELLTGIFQRDQFLATNALFSDGVYQDTAVAMESSQLVLFPNAQFEEFIRQYPDVAQQFIGILSNQVREKEEHLMRLAYHSVRKRIAEALLLVYKQSGKPDGSVSVSRANIAAMTGTAQETVSRTLTDFAAEGLIEKDGNLVLIRNQGKLERLRN